MPFLAQSLDPFYVQRQFDLQLTAETSGVDFARLCAIRVVRYKPERRCLFEFDVVTHRCQTGIEKETFVGKARAKGLDRLTYRVVKSLWQSGFSDTSRDGISVPEPIGMIPDLHMWLQRKIPGTTVTRTLMGGCGVAIARRIAVVANKLHQSGIEVNRTHSISDEIRILHERLESVAQTNPRLENRLHKVLEACSTLAAGIPPPLPTGIHRDFYADQILQNDSRLFILDLDLYTRGDPALDIGNFIGHITEFSLRKYGHADALKDRETAIENRFVELSGEPARVRVRTYALLTLVRHVSLSTQFPERHPFTGAILELCERRLANLVV